MREFLALIKKWMTRLLAGIATVLLSIMTLLVLYQVFTRYILNSPAAFTEELVRYFLIWTGFIGAGNHRDMCTFQAECTMTFLTIKMRM